MNPVKFRERLMRRERRAADWVASDVSKNQGPASAIHLYNICM